MKIVLDNNILFSIMNPFSIAAYLFSSIKAEFFVPEFIKKEFSEHREECLIKSKISEEQFEMRQIEIEESIQFINPSEYEHFLEDSFELISDLEDIDFLALALSINASIWSNDEHFKEQSSVPTFTTEDLVEKLLNREM